jgi:hypothetical protein
VFVLFLGLFVMHEKLQQPWFFLNVEGVDEDVASTTPNQIRSSSLLVVENVHLEFSNVTLLNIVNVL